MPRVKSERCKFKVVGAEAVNRAGWALKRRTADGLLMFAEWRDSVACVHGSLHGAQQALECRPDQSRLVIVHGSYPRFLEWLP